MKCAFVSASLSRQAGGIFEIELALAHTLTKSGTSVCALGLEDEFWKLDAGSWNGIDAQVLPVKGPTSFGFCPEMTQTLLERDFDICHLHTMWMFPSLAVTSWRKATRKPLVVSPNGMLEPWALNNSRLKKRIAAFLYENKMLASAACLHANTIKELRDIRDYGLRNPVAVIPNGVHLPIIPLNGANNLGHYLLFLGRIHPKKGLENALRAWHETNSTRPETNGSPAWQFVIAGWDQGGHELKLQGLCNVLGIPWATIPAIDLVRHGGNCHPKASVIFTGPAFGNTKAELFKRAGAFTLPSFSEGLPMAVLEAWSYGLPVVMTDFCNLPEGFAVGAALKTGTDTPAIAASFRELLTMSNCDRLDMGARGRQLVQMRFSWSNVGHELKDVYDWVLGAGPVPSCVYLI